MPSSSSCPSNPDLSDEWRFCFDVLNEAASHALARDLAPLLRPSDVLALDGDVGMGKSTFARALLRAVARDEALEVPSPTFTLVQTYDLDGLELSHFDLYRIGDFEDLYEIGFVESWEHGCALVEWPDRAEEILPEQTLWLHFEDSPLRGSEARRLVLQGAHIWQDRLERVCRKRTLLIEADWGKADLQAIEGDLSPRSYQRAVMDGQSAILMDMPSREPGPKLDDGRLYDRVAHRVTSLAPMLTIAHALKEAGLLVPTCYSHDLGAGLALWQDFGRESLSQQHDAQPPVAIAQRYAATIDALADFHDKGWQGDQRDLQGPGGAFCLSLYDRDAFEVELSIFLDWYWPFLKGEACPCAARNHFQALWRPALDILLEAEHSLVLRDVQDPNCFWLETMSGTHKIGFIDFQDCLLGPSAYDIASVCMDARVTISVDLENHLKAAYMQHRSFDRTAQEAFEHQYALCGLQRTSKNLGAFARATMSLTNRSYLTHIPRGIEYLARCLAHPALRDLCAFYNENKLLDLPKGL
ncbi:MAG: tRNA (adenosine(37)-N6)-threonylcarbamoyltransferase complex ATPase subunit type 1 TsaE [Cohaesibacter sp.]|nr:tRNA (adenosine(37)-N6)-threonylcarbamoyltransferase complex ATPase subunit type 1 TsaE [Cohaesibacter sp.]MCV6602146.1 tRNA (adenosine(37)-N6)-threonylcarbamoyltransferase complex ATPase subunit type 1 TsaE [Cohaesibacter sp.]